MRHNPEQVIRHEIDPRVWRLNVLRRQERAYALGFRYVPTTDRREPLSAIDITAVRREIAELEGQLAKTYTLEEILAEL